MGCGRTNRRCHSWTAVQSRPRSSHQLYPLIATKSDPLPFYPAPFFEELFEDLRVGSNLGSSHKARRSLYTVVGTAGRSLDGGTLLTFQIWYQSQAACFCPYCSFGSGVSMNHITQMLTTIKAVSARQSPAGEGQESFSLRWEFWFYGFCRKRK